MFQSASDLRLNEPDVWLVGKLSAAERFSLAAASAIAALNVLGWLEPATQSFFRGGWRPMSAEAAVATLLTAIGLQLLHPRQSQPKQIAGAALALLVATGSATVFFGRLLYAKPILSSTVVWIAKGMTPRAAGCFALAGLAAAMIRGRSRLAELAADISTCCFAFLVLVLASGHVIGKLQLFGPTANFNTSPQTVLCLVLLLCAVLIRRAKHGVFSILLGSGIGSKVARLLTPILVLLPYVREGVRAHLFSRQEIPAHYVTAVLATGVMVVSMALLMYLAWRLNMLEAEIQGLSLRDPLTGLNNLRGFRLLSEQALLLAYRSGQPFSVLYIDVDNLKQINDSLGHEMGSAFLAATADLLRETFRETDVLGRIGGDEFAVAGQFSRSGITEAGRRLQREATVRVVRGTKIPLSMSVGSVTSSEHKRESLADLLARADAEMYREKKARKEAAKALPEQGANAPAPATKAARLHELEPS